MRARLFVGRRSEDRRLQNREKGVALIVSYAEGGAPFSAIDDDNSRCGRFVRLLARCMRSWKGSEWWAKNPLCGSVSIKKRLLPSNFTAGGRLAEVANDISGREVLIVRRCAQPSDKTRITRIATSLRLKAFS